MNRLGASNATAAGPGVAGFLGSALAWTLHLVASWILTPAACELEAGTLILHGATAAAAILALSATAVSWRVWRAAEQLQHDAPTIASDRSAWFGASGVLLGVLFTGAILFAGFLNFAIDSCEAHR